MQRSVTRGLAGVVCGRRAKWVVLAMWLVITAVLGVGLGSQLTDEESNEASSWLPESAESTKALNQIDVFQSENTFPTTMVYERTSGITAQDLAAVRADIADFQSYNGRTVSDIVGDDIPDGDAVVTLDGPIRGPITSPDGQAVQVEVPVNAARTG